MLPQTVIVRCHISVDILKTSKHLQLICLVHVKRMMLETTKNNRQNVASFSVSDIIRELTSPWLHWSASYPVSNFVQSAS